MRCLGGVLCRQRSASGDARTARPEGSPGPASNPAMEAGETWAVVIPPCCEIGDVQVVRYLRACRSPRLSEGFCSSWPWLPRRPRRWRLRRPGPLPPTLFVDQNRAQAADTNPGTAEKPFKTISAGVAKLQPGDTLWVRKGVYREDVRLKRENDRNEARATTLAAWRRRPCASSIPRGRTTTPGTR